VGVTSSSQNLKDTVLDGEEGDIECSTSQVVNDDLRLGLSGSVKTVGCKLLAIAHTAQARLTDSGGSWLVDDSENSETSDCAGILGSRSLSVVEVCLGC
jgi:hypothetical protein